MLNAKQSPMATQLLTCLAALVEECTQGLVDAHAEIRALSDGHTQRAGYALERADHVSGLNAEPGKHRPDLRWKNASNIHVSN